MKLAGTLPTPTLTATVVRGAVTIDGLRGEPVFQPRTCSVCSEPGHNIRRCTKRRRSR